MADAAVPTALPASWAKDVLAFWFDELTPEDWFTTKPETDEKIRTRFGALHAALTAALPDAAWTDPEAALAAILVFDQFPRNIFRGTGEAFATDSLAAELARKAVDHGFDQTVPVSRRMFYYMPFMHSEVLADQERCIQLFAAAGSDTKYAVEHRDIIAKYGRFPHRNRALGRTSTTAEQTFLGEHKGFGQ
jgi:uncharacterized protein (DUF924 family)